LICAVVGDVVVEAVATPPTSSEMRFLNPR